MNASLRLLHRSVPGRARFAVPGLRHNPEFEALLGRALAESSLVRWCRVDALSGNLLVRYAPELSLDRLEEELARAVSSVGGRTVEAPPAEASGARAQAPPRASRPRERSRKAARSLLPRATRWHALELGAVIELLESSASDGLAPEAVESRRAQFGPNELPSVTGRGDLAILAEQFLTLPVGMLGASAGVSLLTGGLADALAIGAVVLVNGGIGYSTERQAERTIRGLESDVARYCTVRRGGQDQVLPVTGLVPGDLVRLRRGERVPADLRLVECRSLSIDESALTGESEPVAKSVAFLGDEDTVLADRRNMAFMGTVVLGGSGLGVVTETALSTEIGKIQALAGSAAPPETPMHRNLGTIGRQLVWVTSGVCGGVFALGLLRRQPLVESLKNAISLAVAAVPEGLPTVATTTLATGIRHMRRQNVAVRHLDAVESLGATQIFCMDKTGTLTFNRMTVDQVFAGMREASVDPERLRLPDPALERDEVRRLLEVICLCNDSRVSQEGNESEQGGSPTEIALLRLAEANGVEQQVLENEYPRRGVRHRAEDQPYMTTLHARREAGVLLAVKGRPDAVLEFCSHHLVGGVRRRLTRRSREQILARNEAMAGRALRVLGVAMGSSDATENLVWLGLVGMRDPLRREMSELMERFHAAGIRTVMITGDQPATARAIAAELGLRPDGPVRILESTTLDSLDAELLRGLVRDVDVFARVSPSNKLQIVQALQRNGYVVAMTGDGINDSPALRAADVGVVMGQSGTSVARSVSDVVLEDDNLHSMIVAVREGRTIFDNIRKTIRFLLSTNLSEIELMAIGLLATASSPLNAPQLLWLNLVTDVFPGLALAMEAPGEDVLTRPPRARDESLMRRSDALRTLRESGVITTGALASYLYAIARYGPGGRAQTHAFTSLTLAQLLHAISCRSDGKSVFAEGRLPRNRYLEWALGGTLGLQAIAQLLPPLRRLLRTTPLGVLDVLVCAAAAAAPFLVNETIKLSPPGERRDVE